ncbi:MAG: hypothetical protein ACKOD9_16585 [Rubrivivax sp.]
MAEAAQVAGRVHFVGHSLGAVLLRGVLARPQPFPVGRVVMLAPPNAGVSLLQRGELRRLARLLYGRPALELAPGSTALRDLPDLPGRPGPGAETGVIAGSARFHPFNPSSYWHAVLRPHAPDHDGTVDVAATRLPGMRDFLVLPVNHSFMPDHPDVARQVLAFIATGAFARAEC